MARLVVTKLLWPRTFPLASRFSLLPITSGQESLISANIITWCGLREIPCVFKGIWVLFGSFFKFSDFYWLDLHWKFLSYISNSTMKHQQKMNWKMDFLWSSYDYRKRIFVDFLNDCMRPPNCIHYLSVE